METANGWTERAIRYRGLARCASRRAAAGTPGAGATARRAGNR